MANYLAADTLSQRVYDEIVGEKVFRKTKDRTTKDICRDSFAGTSVKTK